MTPFRLFLVFLLSLLFTGSLSAQPADNTGQGYLFRNLDNVSGLLSDEVFSVTQDSLGYIWIGTRKGLQRYDGFRFRNFVDSGAATNEGLGVSTLFADAAKDRVMYNLFDQQILQRSGADHRRAVLFPEKEFDAARATAYRAADGSQWQNERYFISRTRAAGRITEGIMLVKEPGKNNPYFTFFVSDKNTNKTWVSVPRHMLLLFDDSLGRVYEPVHDPDHNPLFGIIRNDSLALRKIYMDHKGDIWLVDWSEKLYRWTTAARSLQVYDLSAVSKMPVNLPGKIPVWATSVLEDDHNVLWVGTGHAGLLRFQSDSNKFTATLHRSGDALSLQYNHEINSLFQDKEENIWVATDKGVSFFNPYQRDFLKLNETEGDPDRLMKSENNGGLIDAAGNLVLAYWGGGLKVYDRNFHLKKTVRFSDRENNMIWGLLPDGKGRTWVVCQHGYIHLLDSNYVTLKTLHPAEMENSTIRCIARDSRGNLYFGLHNGKTVTWDAGRDTFESYDPARELPHLRRSSVLHIFIDDQDRCWAGNQNGLLLFDRKTHAYSKFFKPAVGMPTPCHGMAQLNDSILVTGLENAGLYYFNLRSGLFSEPPGTGRPFSANAFAVRKDAGGDIWFTSDYDVCHYDTKRHIYSISSPEKGFLNSSFEGNYFISNAEGKWFSWTRTEMIGFDPGVLSAAEKSGAPVSITGFSVFDNPLLIDSLITAKQAVELSYKDNFIGISFSNLQFSRAAHTRYFYRLRGVDKNWVAGGPRHFASYTNLAPGSYRFEVTTGDVTNTRDMAAFDLTVRPPFWQTAWFRSLLVLLVAGVLLLIVGGYIRNIRRESDMKQQIVRTEMMALRAQMNPHFIFNCINSIDALIQSDDKYLATVYLNKFAKLIRYILDSSKETTITLRRDLETLQLYVDLERFRNRENFSVEIRADENLLQQDYKVPPLIIQPYVENAILHGLRHREEGGGKLTIDISRQQDQLLYVIEDNGVGRSAAKASNKKYRSYGMEMSLDRLKLFNQQSEIPVSVTDLMENGRAAGTRVEVSLQIK